MFFALTSTAAFADSAMDVYKAFKRVEAQLQTSINAKSFNDAYVDAKTELSIYAESPEAAKTPAFVGNIKNAEIEYGAANTFIITSHGYSESDRSFISGRAESASRDLEQAKIALIREQAKIKKKK
jgi:hypothetical protein